MLLCVALLSGLPPVPALPAVEVLSLAQIAGDHPRHIGNYAWLEPWPRPGRVFLRRGHENLLPHELYHLAQSYAGVFMFEEQHEVAARDAQRRWAAGECLPK